MTASAFQVLPERKLRAPDLPSAQELDRELRNASPADVIAAAVRAVGRERLAVVSSFGTESAALLKVVADVNAAIPVIFLDTGWLFEETLAYRDTLIATLGLHQSVPSSRWKPRWRARIPIASCGFPIPMRAAGSGRSNRWRGRWRRSMDGSTAASASRAAPAP